MGSGIYLQRYGLEAKPPGVGESSPVIIVVGGFGNLVVGAVLLWLFWPRGDAAWAGWCWVGAGVLLLGVLMAGHFGKVRGGKR